MPNINTWGEGSANNTIGWGKGANNLISWGKLHSLSYAGLTNIVGSTQSGGTAPPQLTAPFVVSQPTVPVTNICANSANSLTMGNMVWGGYPTPVITYSWYQVNPLGGDFNDIPIGQYTDTLYLDYSLAETYLYCLITATNSEGFNEAYTPQIYATDCS